MGGYAYGKPGKPIQQCPPFDELAPTKKEHIFQGQFSIEIKRDGKNSSNRGRRPKDSFAKWSPAISVTCSIKQIIKVGPSDDPQAKAIMDAYMKSTKEKIEAYKIEEREMEKKEILKYFTSSSLKRKKKDEEIENKENDSKKIKNSNSESRD